MESPGSPSEGLSGARMASETPSGFVATFEVEYDAQTEREARSRALRDAEYLFQQPDVLAVTVDGKKTADELFPLTKAYLDNEAELA